MCESYVNGHLSWKIDVKLHLIIYADTFCKF